MIWIRFDEEDRRTPAPPFCLDSVQGNRVCLQDLYEEHNLVLVFTHELSRRESCSLIQTFEERDQEYRKQGSKVLVIVPNGDHDPEVQEGSGFSEGMLARMLVDPLGITRRSYTNLMSASLVEEEDMIVFVLDAYGAPYTAVVARELGTSEVHEEILNWLQYISIQCPE
jgi:peroxiredoxin